MKRALVLTVTAAAIASATPNGAEIFKRCAICHGDKAQKRSLNVSKIIAGMDAKHIVETLKAYQAGEINQYGFGRMMQGQATKLSEEQMNAVALYVQSLPTTEVVEKKKEPAKPEKLSKEKLDQNTFTQNYFKENPNATYSEAKRKWEAYKNGSSTQ